MIVTHKDTEIATFCALHGDRCIEIGFNWDQAHTSYAAHDKRGMYKRNKMMYEVVCDIESFLSILKGAQVVRGRLFGQPVYGTQFILKSKEDVERFKNYFKNDKRFYIK